MVLAKLFRNLDDYVIEPLEREHASAVSVLHDDGFQRPWSEDEFLGLLAKDNVFGFVARLRGNRKKPPVGFVLARLAAGEGEILTITVARGLRGIGLGRALMDAVLRHLHAERALALFLEVDEANRWAIALYRRLGFREVGKRPGYYKSEGGGGALILRRDLQGH